MTMTEQEIFERVARHLLTQMRQSRSRTVLGAFRCAYRGEDDCKCAIGCLIPDDEYRIEFEGILANLFDYWKTPNAVALRPHYGYLRELQHIHDRDLPKDWRQDLTSFAAARGLTMPEGV